jgi:hypothetical protein
VSDQTAPQRDDFLARRAAAAARNPLREAIHARSSEALLSLYRLVKISLVHAVGNEAVGRTIETTYETLKAFSGAIGRPVTITVAHEMVFVCGELLRGSRSTYETALELRDLLGRCGVSEVSVAAELSVQDLRSFTEILSAALRDPEKRTLLLESAIPNVEARAVQALLSGGEGAAAASVRERALMTYASALVVVRQLYDAAAAGQMVLPHKVKRVAQRLIVLADESEATLLGLTTLAHAQRDDVVRAVHAAILAVVMGRQITRNPAQLASLAMVALLADAGRAQVAGLTGRNRLVALTEDAERTVPAHAAAIPFVAGGLDEGSALRAVLAFETTWLERQRLLGPPYGGQIDTLVQSQILRAVRRLLDLVAPRDFSEAISPFDALATISEEIWLDPHLLRVLVSAIGIIPIGSVVELETGEWGVVTDRSSNEKRSHMPLVRVVTTKRGAAVEAERYVDYGLSGRKPGIARVLPAAAARFNVTRAFFD